MASKGKSSRNKGPESPVLPKLTDLPPFTPSPALPKGKAPTLEDDCEFELFRVEGTDLSQNQASSLSLRSAFLQHVKLNDSSFPKLHVVDLRLDCCDLSNASCPQSRLNRVEILNSRLTGLNAVEGKISNCRLTDCVLELAQFSACRFESTIFQNCRLKGADFRFTDLSGARFINCELEGAEFYDANLRGADFRGSNLAEIKARVPDLKGAVIDSNQAIELAAYFATLLGVEVKDSQQ